MHKTKFLDEKNIASMHMTNTDDLRFPLSNFRHSLTLFSKFFSSFLHSTCSLSVSHPYLALDGIYHQLWAAIPNNSTPLRGLQVQTPRGRRDSHPLWYHIQKDLLLGLHKSRMAQHPKVWQHGLFPLQSPLLRESLLVSFPPLNNMLKFSGSSCLIGDPKKRSSWFLLSLHRQTCKAKGKTTLHIQLKPWNSN